VLGNQLLKFDSVDRNDVLVLGWEISESTSLGKDRQSIWCPGRGGGAAFFTRGESGGMKRVTYGFRSMLLASLTAQFKAVQCIVSTTSRTESMYLGFAP
jgi:hypothetical protein